MFRLWGAERSGPYFTALHFFFGIGNAAGPILAEIFLGGGGDDEETEKGNGFYNSVKPDRICKTITVT